jgi:hypothetical protein
MIWQINIRQRIGNIRVSQFVGRTAIISGYAKGIGLSIAKTTG